MRWSTTSPAPSSSTFCPPRSVTPCSPRSAPARRIGITGFTLPTLYRWIHSQEGLEAALHPYRKGHYLGSGQGEAVLAEAGLDGESQFSAIKAYVDAARRVSTSHRRAHGSSARIPRGSTWTRKHRSAASTSRASPTR